MFKLEDQSIRYLLHKKAITLEALLFVWVALTILQINNIQRYVNCALILTESIALRFMDIVRYLPRHALTLITGLY